MTTGQAHEADDAVDAPRPDHLVDDAPARPGSAATGRACEEFATAVMARVLEQYEVTDAEPMTPLVQSLRQVHEAQSADGRRQIMAELDDEFARVWDATTTLRTELARLRKHCGGDRRITAKLDRLDREVWGHLPAVRTSFVPVDGWPLPSLDELDEAAAELRNASEIAARLLRQVLALRADVDRAAAEAETDAEAEALCGVGHSIDATALGELLPAVLSANAFLERRFPPVASPASTDDCRPNREVELGALATTHRGGWSIQRKAPPRRHGPARTLAAA